MAEKNRILSFNIDKYQMEFPQYVSHSGLQNTYLSPVQNKGDSSLHKSFNLENIVSFSFFLQKSGK